MTPWDFYMAAAMAGQLASIDEKDAECLRAMGDRRAAAGLAHFAAMLADAMIAERHQRTDKKEPMA